MPLPALELRAQLMRWGAPERLWAFGPIWVHLGQFFDPKMAIFGLNWSNLGGYRTVSRHPMDMVGVGLSMLALHEPESMPLLAFGLFSARFGEDTEPCFLTKIGHFWPEFAHIGGYGTWFFEAAKMAIFGPNWSTRGC